MLGAVVSLGAVLGASVGPPLGALMATRFPLETSLNCVLDGSPFSRQLLKELFSSRSLVLFGTGPQPLGKKIFFLAQNLSSLEETYFDHVGPSYVLLRDKPPQPAKVLQGEHTETYVLQGNTSVLVMDKVNSAFVDLFPNGIKQELLDPLKHAIFRRVVVSTFNCSVFSRIGPIAANGRPEWLDGVEMRLVREIAGRLGLDWRLEPAAGFGGISATGEWIPGINEELAWGRADLGLCSVWILPQLRHAVDHAYPWTPCSLTLLVPRPRATELHWSTILGSYSPLVWVFFALGNFLLAATFALLRRLRLRLLFAVPQSWKVGELLRDILVHLSSSSVSPTTLGRPLVLSSSLLFLLLSAGYSSQLVPLLTSPELSPKISSVDRFVDGGCVWGMNSYPENLRHIRTDTDARFSERYVGDLSLEEKKRLMEEGCYGEVGQSVDLLFFINDPVPLGTYDRHEALLPPLSDHMFSLVMRKGWVLSRAVERVVSALREAGSSPGISRRLAPLILRNVFTPTSSAPLLHSPPPPLPLSSFSGLFAVFSLGLLVSLFCFLWETRIYVFEFSYFRSYRPATEGVPTYPQK